MSKGPLSPTGAPTAARRPLLQPGPVAVSLSTLCAAEAVCCHACRRDLFVSVFFLRRISPLLSPSGREELVRVDVWACATCGHVNEEQLPQGFERPAMPDAGEAGEGPWGEG